MRFWPWARPRATVRAIRDAYVADHQYFVTEAPRPYFLLPDLLDSAGELSALSPSQLLSVGNRAVPFAFREQELRELGQWRDGGSASSAFLLYAPGGQGKTRLADKFFTESVAAGRQVRAARHVAEMPYPSAGTGDGDAALVVVDYADRWPLDDLLRLACEIEDRSAAPARLLLLARSRDWWIPMRHRLGKLGWELRQRRLDPLTEPTADRVEAFHQARDRFAAILKVPGVRPVRSPPHLQGRQFDLVLSIHMAALASVLAFAEGTAEPPSADPVQVSAFLLDRERSYWESLRTAGRINAKLTTMSRAVVGAVLAGPLPYPGGVSLLDCGRISSSAEPAELVLDDHKVCYPAMDPAHVLQPLYPDRLAEDFLALQIPGATPHEPWEGDPAIERILENLMGPATELPRETVERMIVVLVETARRWQHVADRQFFPIVTSRPDLGFTMFS